MLVIRDEQINRFREARRQQAENHMLAHVRKRFPFGFHLLGEELVRLMARDALRRAAAYGIGTESGATLFLHLMLRLGVDLDRDPQLGFIAGTLKDATLTGQARIRSLHQEAGRYLAAVEGPGRAHLVEAMHRMEAFPEVWFAEPQICFMEELREALRLLYPEKCARMGPKPLEAVVARAGRKATSYTLETASGQALLSAMILLAGSGVLEDPRFPEVQQVLERTDGEDAGKRAAHLRDAFRNFGQILTEDRVSATREVAFQA